MKRRFDILWLLAIALVMNACTLMLDEPEASETEETEVSNGDGFSAPKTEVNEFGTTSYQFNDNVKLIDERYRPYLIGAQTDTETGITKTYFLKTIPADLLPAQGEMLATTLHDIYTGLLNDKVDVVENAQNGTIVVSSHVVSLEDVYKVLNFDVEAAIVEVEDPDTRSEAGEGKKVLRAVGLGSNVVRSDDWDTDITHEFCNIKVNLFNGVNAHFKPYELNSAADYLFSSLVTINPTTSSSGKVRFGVKSDMSAYCFFKAKAIVKCSYGLKEFLKGNIRLKANYGYGYQFKEFSSYVSIPIFATTGMSTNKDGIFPKQTYLTARDFLVQGNEVFVGVGKNLPFKMGLAFNLAFTADIAGKLESKEPFKYEESYEWEPYVWTFVIDLISSPINLLPHGTIKKNTTVTIPSSFSKKTGFRLNLHADVALVVGAEISKDDITVAGIDVIPAKFNLDSNYKYVEETDFNSSNPLTLKDGNGNTMYATDKSRSDGDLSFDVQFAQDIAITGAVADFLREWKIIDLTKNFFNDETKPKVIPFHYSPFPQLTASLTFDKKNTNSEVARYGVTVKQEANRAVKHTDFKNIRLLIYDEKYKFLKEVNPLESNPTNYDPKTTYKFEPLDMYINGELGHSTYFYAVPCYQSMDGSVNYFCRPQRYQVRGDWGRITEMQPLNITNSSQYIEMDKTLTGFAFTGQYSFEINQVKYVYVKVEFLDTYGQNVYTHTYEYKTGNTQSGTIKSIFLVKHNILTEVEKVVVTMYYENPNNQSSSTPWLRQTVLDEDQIKGLSTPQEYWPEYDYIDHDEWKKKGYRSY